MSWRPEKNWVNPYTTTEEEVGKDGRMAKLIRESYYRAFEAGADAMLEVFVKWLDGHHLDLLPEGTGGFHNFIIRNSEWQAINETK